MTTLKINGIPVAVVPVVPTEGMVNAGRLVRCRGRLTTSESAALSYTAMLAAADPSATAAVVELREALAAIPHILADMKACGSWDTATMDRVIENVTSATSAALARVEVSRG